MSVLTKIITLLCSEVILYMISYSLGHSLVDDYYLCQAYQFMSFHGFLFIVFFIIPGLKFYCMYDTFSMFLIHGLGISMHSIKGIVMLASEESKLLYRIHSEIALVIFAGIALIFLAGMAGDLGLWFDFNDPSFQNFSAIDSIRDSLARHQRRKLFEKIPTIKLTKEMLSEIDQGGVCLREYIENEIIKILPNGYHLFHIECIRDWFESSKTCPYCRNDPTAEEIEEFSKLSQKEINSKIYKKFQ